MKRHTAELLLFVITILWAGTFAVIKTEITDVRPSMFVLLRFATASVIALAIWWRAVASLDARTVKRGMILGFLYGVGFLLQTMGLTMTTASTSAFITGTMVVFVPIVHRFADGARVKLDHIASIVLVLLGLGLFTAPEAHGINPGDVLTLLSAICWAVYLTYIDVWTSELRNDVQKQNGLVVLQFLATVVLAAIGVGYDAASGVAMSVVLDRDLLIALAYCAVLASVIPTFVQTRYQQYTHPVRAGVIFAVEPLAAAVIAWFLIDETFSMRQIIGGCVLMAAIILPDALAMRKRT